MTYPNMAYPSRGDTDTDTSSEFGIGANGRPLMLIEPRPGFPAAAETNDPNAVGTSNHAAAVTNDGAVAETNEAAAAGGTHLDDLFRTILDRLDQQDALTTERLDAIAAAQMASQDQINLLQAVGGNAVQPLGDENAIHPQQTPAERRSRARRARPTSIVVGTIDVPIRDHERAEDASPHRVREVSPHQDREAAPRRAREVTPCRARDALPRRERDASPRQANDTPPRRARVASPRDASLHRARSASPRRAKSTSRRDRDASPRRARDASPHRARDASPRRSRDSPPRRSNKSSSRRHSDEDEAARDEELEQLRTTLKDMSSKLHRAITSAPELEKVLEETQRSPFTTRISKVRVRHTKLKLAKFEGDSDPKQFLTTISIAIGRAHFPPRSETQEAAKSSWST